MSIRKFCWLLSEAKVNKRDQEWFPRWLRRYGETVRVVGNFPVSEAAVIRFSRSLRNNGARLGNGCKRLVRSRRIETWF